MAMPVLESHQRRPADVQRLLKGMNSMLRAILLYLSQAGWARRMVTRQRVTWRVASRVVAGETLAEAVRPVRERNQAGLFVTLDDRGKDTSTVAEPVRAAGGDI